MVDKKTEKPKIIRPDAVINLSDRIYLAVAPDSKAKDKVIHTLACIRRENRNDYDLTASHEKNLFVNPDVAQLFYNEIVRSVAENKANKVWKIAFDWNETEIKEFMQNVR